MLGLHDWTGLVLTVFVLLLVITLAIAVTPMAVAGIAGYVGFRLYKESPARAERIAKAETMALYDAARAQQVSFDDDEIDTLGGLVFMLAGRVPARGEVVPHPNESEFEVMDADPRRVKRLRVRVAGGAG